MFVFDSEVIHCCPGVNNASAPPNKIECRFLSRVVGRGSRVEGK